MWTFAFAAPAVGEKKREAWLAGPDAVVGLVDLRLLPPRPARERVDSRSLYW